MFEGKFVKVDGQLLALRYDSTVRHLLTFKSLFLFLHPLSQVLLLSPPIISTSSYFYCIHYLYLINPSSPSQSMAHPAHNLPTPVWYPVHHVVRYPFKNGECNLCMSGSEYTLNIFVLHKILCRWHSAISFFCC